MKLNCKICNKEYVRYGKQALTSKCCSFDCLSIHNSGEKNVKCQQCNKLFHIKSSAINRYKRNHGFFCNISCYSEFKKTAYLNENNPNFREQVTTDQNGYKLSYLPKIGRIKLHHAVVLETLKLNKIPKGYHVHHRDCNINNNDPSNLSLLSCSDHKWLHKQFGNATLWAYMQNKISLEELLQWTNNKEKASRLLPLSILDQIGIFKQEELLENPTTNKIVNEDNQQPSLDSNIFEGSTTNNRVLTCNDVDSNVNTSILPV